MKVQHLQMKGGGRVLEVKSIAHSTYRGRAEWFFVCEVQWSDTGKTRDDVHVYPYSICYNHDNPDACVEGTKVFALLSDYLREHGQWRDGIQWIPKVKALVQPLDLIAGPRS